MCSGMCCTTQFVPTSHSGGLTNAMCNDIHKEDPKMSVDMVLPKSVSWTDSLLCCLHYCTGNTSLTPYKEYSIIEIGQYENVDPYILAI